MMNYAINTKTNGYYSFIWASLHLYRKNYLIVSTLVEIVELLSDLLKDEQKIGIFVSLLLNG